ncbi:MAG: hypothetical protein A3G81_16870 [Betaproteobacteria bacterium RIFCSPLOWO2_12_FULL_65_14]|nr:MAG: hypothetical protein A3G81_16870 [Betaproteobacteria bacterium RIFCSPLOWO2_12_FULL_65_14]
MDQKRKVILHYHIFKNAGTSVDRMLKESLGERWASWDTDNPGGKISPAEMEAFILDRPDIAAVSSHQVVPPLPDRHLDVFPIVFLRHPIDRAYSAYLFEWKKQQGVECPKGSFEDYVAEKFKHPRKNAIEDFQTLHFANRGYEARWPAGDLDDEVILNNAKRFLLSLPFFGLVEDYERSLGRMKKALAGRFPELSFKAYRENALQEETRTLFDKVRAIRSETAPETYSQLVLRNQLDLRLYEFACAYASAVRH